MHIRFLTSRTSKGVRRYAQLVQSYRRPDGMPTQKVIATLGQLPEQLVESFRAALAAMRAGKTLVFPPAPLPASRSRTRFNLEYLDAAVALDLWRDWKLSELLCKIIPEDGVVVPAADVIAALAIQRCISPGSKLEAQRWFPRTALPELLGVGPAQFNNARVHRVLDQLDQAEKALQEGLAERYLERGGRFLTLFVDVTDVWFEGRGCDLAERSRTKIGIPNIYKVGILLVCSEHGYPIHWRVLAGKKQDNVAMLELIDQIEKVSWARRVPIIFDRAMGHSGAVGRLIKSGLEFITAVRRPEFPNYTEALPTAPLADMGGSEDETEQARLEEEAAARVVKAGMEKLHERLFIQDFGVLECDVLIPETSSIEPTTSPEDLQGGALFLHQARAYRQQLDQKVFRYQEEIAKRTGLTKARISQIMALLRLDEQLQREVLANAFGPISDRDLREIAMLSDRGQQRRALEERRQTPRRRKRPLNRADGSRRSRRSARLRVVAYFNPEMFVEQRTTGERHRREVETRIADLNLMLRNARGPRSRDAVYCAADDIVRKRGLGSVYKVEIVEVPSEQATRWEARATLDEAAWARRRRFDGFILLVAHPDLKQAAAEIVHLYHAKDAIEKDFQTVKTDLKLRPMYHHTDPKVRAHVSLCMLALLLERTLETKLREAGAPMTAPACFEELHSMHLNMIKTSPDAEMVYQITDITPEQQAILKHLGLAHLADDLLVAEQLTPRPT